MEWFDGKWQMLLNTRVLNNNVRSAIAAVTYNGGQMYCFSASLFLFSLFISTAFLSRKTDLKGRIKGMLIAFKTFESTSSAPHYP